MENIIHKLLDLEYVNNLFKGQILPAYDFVGIKKITVKTIKKMIWQTTYHVVFKYDVSFLTKENKINKLQIFCSAHSSEPRKNVYDVLEFLWQHQFAKGNLTIPHPLFYSSEFNATFYRGVKGENLYYYIRNKDFKEIEELLPRAAAWFAKLHVLSPWDAKNFNVENSRLKTVFPGSEHIFNDIKMHYPQYLNFYQQAYDLFIAKEEKFLGSSSKHWLIHGDAHPENVIKISKNRLALIDFTDVCLSDFARDLGTFTQQLEYMSNRKIGDSIYTEKLKTLFLNTYFKIRKIELTEGLQARIDNYYNWTAIRTANHFLLKHDMEPERAKPLIEMVSRNLNIKI